ncbi:DUF1661 domain-containing protein [Porphyromonas gulae]|nr:DUF1661 domain-containing protein [Porphyromonas gulae]
MARKNFPSRAKTKKFTRHIFMTAKPVTCTEKS